MKTKKELLVNEGKFPTINLLDVRSPLEFSKGHIPGAINYPLFSDDERAKVGTVYKQKGSDLAIIEGLKIVGPKMHEIVTDCREIFPDKKILVHCWRGGMRSNSVSWLLNQAGFETNILQGGYKAYRARVREFLSGPFKLVIISGTTGSGKTDVLHALKDLGEQVIDLEGLACHKGSSFGAIGQPEQPSIEQFENNLANELTEYDAEDTIWIEDESRRIGKINMEDHFWNQMKRADFVSYSIPEEERVKRLVADYGAFDFEELKQSLIRIGKRLGPQHLKGALTSLEEGNLEEVVKTCLVYYDKTYNYGQSKKQGKCLNKFEFDYSDPRMIAQELKNSRQ
ncbi:MAG: tRNA 2-selenouridine(34) synthase MnmH [Bacteroidia bacterium]